MAVFVQVAEFIKGLVAQFGYLGIFTAMVIEGILTPIPSPIFLPFAGDLARDGVLSFPLVIIVATTGATLGSLVAYFIGFWLGRSFLLRYGKFFGVQERHLDLADRWFERYGNWAVLVGNAVTGIRSVISFPAGITRMPLRGFVPFTFLGALVWTTVLVAAGYFLGDAAFAFAESLESFDLWVLGLLGAGLLFLLAYRRWRNRRAAGPAAEP